MSRIRRTRVEDYLAAIDQVCEDGNLDRARTGVVAKTIGVSKGTVSSVLKELADAGFIDLAPYEGAKLTEQGRQRARRVLRRYRLMELFLSRTLGVAWEAVAEEAWSLEPAASDRLMELIDSLLARPEFDPHGNPIPRADGTLPANCP